MGQGSSDAKTDITSITTVLAAINTKLNNFRI